MLCLELEARDINVEITESYSAAVSKNPSMIFVDAALIGQKKPAYGIETVIFGRREELAALGSEAYECAVYERPMVVCEMLDKTVGRPSISGSSQRAKRSVSGGLRLYSQSHSATYRGEHIALSKKEFSLLCLLMEKRGEIVKREEATAQIFGDDCTKGTNVVDVYIKYLREKIDDRFGIKLITTVRGVGYKISTE